MVGLLKEFMLDKDIPTSAQVLGAVEHMKPLIYGQKDLLVELFDDLEVVHNRMARVCSHMSSLAKVLDPNQLMIFMKAKIRPMIQLNTTSAFLETPAVLKHKVDIQEDRGEHLWLTMVPNPEVSELKDKKINSPNRLLATTFTYKILKMFTDGTTQQALLEKFKMKVKQLALCITGRQYHGSTDWKARKRRGSDGDTGSSM